MYKLTLTHDERRAIDWIGFRYRHGDELRNILTDCEWPDDVCWDDYCDIEFRIPEVWAWDICNIIDADSLSCFADGLKTKLYEFQGKVV